MNDDFRYEIQTTSTAIFMFLSVMFEYRNKYDGHESLESNQHQMKVGGYKGNK